VTDRQNSKWICRSAFSGTGTNAACETGRLTAILALEAHRADSPEDPAFIQLGYGSLNESTHQATPFRPCHRRKSTL
jgi:hypothetical protein